MPPLGGDGLVLGVLDGGGEVLGVFGVGAPVGVLSVAGDGVGLVDEALVGVETTTGAGARTVNVVVAWLALRANENTSR
jgi:hypothetical protein